MRLLIALSALALVASGTARAGGWATVGLASLPDGVEAGEVWRAEITVRRHGVTPTDGAAPSLTIRSTGTDATRTFPAEPTGDTGVYEARVVFPEAGAWSFEIDNGLSATGYGESATTTYAPVTIGAGPSGSPSSLPTRSFAALAVALGLAAASVFAFRQLRRLTPAGR